MTYMYIKHIGPVTKFIVYSTDLDRDTSRTSTAMQTDLKHGTLNEKFRGVVRNVGVLSHRVGAHSGVSTRFSHPLRQVTRVVYIQ